MIECGKLLQRAGYRIKVLNTINFKKSMHYNPFVFRISAFTSFRISFSERMYASGLYLMDFLKLMRLRHLIRYFFRSRKEPTSGRRVPFGFCQ